MDGKCKEVALYKEVIAVRGRGAVFKCPQCKSDSGRLGSRWTKRAVGSIGWKIHSVRGAGGLPGEGDFLSNLEK